mmetsp:Transcript_15129/g.10988  ORF Transcript_15129/g.10988 Transcript_15129/m.10988 type:complete len:105 (-) Transcript_15129:85-399(-)
MQGCDDKKYECVLQMGGMGEAQFQVVEMSSFRDIVHISLKLKQGTDDHIKKYLAERLKECKESLEFFRQSGSQMEEGLHKSQTTNEALMIELQQLREENRRIVD